MILELLAGAALGSMFLGGSSQETERETVYYPIPTEGDQEPPIEIPIPDCRRCGRPRGFRIGEYDPLRRGFVLRSTCHDQEILIDFRCIDRRERSAIEAEILRLFEPAGIERGAIGPVLAAR